MIKYVTQVLGKVKDIFKISFACFSLFFPIWLQKKKKKKETAHVVCICFCLQLPPKPHTGLQGLALASKL